MFGLESVVSTDGCLSCRRAGPLLCAACLDSATPSFEPVGGSDGLRVLTALAYEGAPRSLVLALKLRGVRAAAPPLVQAMVSAVHRHGSAAEVVTWVPGRRRDIRRRGFDHAHLLALGLSAALGLPAVPLVARSLAGTPDQAALGRSERWQNVAGAFVAAPCEGPILVADDLVTSGATAAAVGGVLLAGGASEVDLVAPCRTIQGGRDKTSL